MARGVKRAPVGAPRFGRRCARRTLWRTRARSTARVAPGDAQGASSRVFDDTCWHNALPVQLLPIPGPRGIFVPNAPHDRQGRISREPGIGRRPLAQAERGPAAGLDDPRVPARAAQTCLRRGHASTGGWAARARRRSRVAERVGFEPTKSLDSALFKSAAINRSATSPRARVAVQRDDIGRRLSSTRPSMTRGRTPDDDPG